MEFGIYDINTNTPLPFKQRFDTYKQAGFEGVAFFIDQNYLDKGETFEEQIAYANKIGLKIMQVHADYKISNKICDESSNEYFDYVESRITICEKYYLKNLIVHASSGSTPPEISQNQLKKLQNLAKKHPKVNICFENVRSNNNLCKILELNIPNIKMCFDLGHANAYSNVIELFEKLKKYIVCSHLHNNFGTDTHSLLSNGEIDWKPIAKQLAKIKSCSNCLEVFPGHDVVLNKTEFVDFVTRAHADIETL